METICTSWTQTKRVEVGPRLRPLVQTKHVALLVESQLDNHTGSSLTLVSFFSVSTAVDDVDASGWLTLDRLDERVGSWNTK